MVLRRYHGLGQTGGISPGGGGVTEDRVRHLIAQLGLSINSVRAILENYAEVGIAGRVPFSRLPESLERSNYAALLTVWPPNVAQNSDVQRSFKAVLNRLNEDILRLDGGSTGTRFVNRFQIKTRNADRAEVLLHDEAWSYTTEGAQELEWAVSADEFNKLGTNVSTDYIEVWGEFRWKTNAGEEVRGRTQPFVIGFGSESEWPATRGQQQAGDVIQVWAANSGTHLTQQLAAHVLNDNAGVIQITTDFTTAVRSYKNGQRWYIAPHHGTEIFLVLIADHGVGDGGGGTDTTARAAAAEAQRTANENRAEIESEETTRRDMDAALAMRIDEIEQLTQAEKVALLALIPDPAIIFYTDSDDLAPKVKTISIGIPNPELLTGDVWAQGWIQGQPGGSRVKWSTATPSITITLGTSSADAVASALVTDSREFLEVRLRFYDAATAGNEIERVGINIPLVHLDTSAEIGDKAFSNPPKDLKEAEQVAARGAIGVGVVQNLTSAAAITWDVSKGDIATLVAGHNFTLNISNGVNGSFVILRVLQDATGSRVMTLHSSIVLDGRSAPVLSTAANAHDNVLFMRRGSVWVYLGIILNG